MPHFVRRAPVEQIANKTVSVGRHGDQVHTVGARKLDDLVRRLAHRQHMIYHKTLAAQFLGTPFKIGAIDPNFLALS